MWVLTSPISGLVDVRANLTISGLVDVGAKVVCVY